MKFQVQLAKDDKDFHSGPEWFVERKWDGMRAIFEISEDETRIFSRTGQDLRPQFPELQELHTVLSPAILDGEIVSVMDGSEDLERLQLRISQKNPTSELMEKVPITVKFFDILEKDGEDVRSQTFLNRKFLLIDAVGPHFVVETLPHDIQEHQIPREWEGVVSKRASSIYESGRRRSSWLKYKFVQSATLRVTGLTPGKGARASSFGAIVVEDGNGIHRGQVGSGFSPESINQILKLVEVHGSFLIEVEYRFLSKSGLMVNTAYKGVRFDKSEADSL